MTQQEALDILKLGHNVFLTGAAGSGKTHLLNEYIALLRAHDIPVAITASTGIAATHLGGQTIHSWSGIGIRDALSDGEIEELAENDRIRRAIKNTHVLIIDEISMLHAHQLDMVERVTRHIGDFTQPFGGLQVILCGDFFQLPPVSRSDLGQDKKFAHESSAWEATAFRVCYLHEQWRQATAHKGRDGDPLLAVLNDIRNGTAGEHTKVPLRTRYKKPPVVPKHTGDAPVRPTKLYARNINVDAINERELAKLTSEGSVFTMETRGFKKLVEGLKKSCLAPEKLHLKISAEVMFIKNDPDGQYVNGTRGVVEDFDEDNGFPLVRTLDGHVVCAEPDEWRLDENGTVRALLRQIPLRLAWAITIHKSQGMTLDAAEVDLSDTFEPGMGYVALSRVRSLSGLTLMGLNETALEAHPKIREADSMFREQSEAVRRFLKELSDDDKATQQDETLFVRFGGTRDRETAREQKKARAKKKKEKKTPTHLITASFLENKTPLDHIAKERGITLGTVLGHMEKLKGEDKLPDIAYLAETMEDFDAIRDAFNASEDGKLTPIFQKFDEKHSFETLKLVRLFV